MCKDNNQTNYTISVLLQVGPYIYTDFSSLTLNEFKEKYDSWVRNNHNIIRASVSFDGSTFIHFKDFDDLCWVIKYKDDPLFRYINDYRFF